MAKDDIIRMAREAGIDAEKDTLCRFEGWVEPIERFASLVAAAEREVCAKVCEDLLPGNGERVAKAIRALKEQPAEQEPVKFKCMVIDDDHPRGIPLSQWGNLSASKPWVSLTDAQIHKMTVLMGINPEWKEEIEIVRSIVRNLEAILKEKNT